MSLKSLAIQHGPALRQAIGVVPAVSCSSCGTPTSLSADDLSVEYGSALIQSFGVTSFEVKLELVNYLGQSQFYVHSITVLNKVSQS